MAAFTFRSMQAVVPVSAFIMNLKAEHYCDP